MFVSTAARIGLYATVLMARKPEGPVTAREIGRTFSVSENHVAKVLQQLVRGRLVRSARGAGGGYRLAGEADAVTMLDVVECLEGPLTERCRDCSLSHTERGSCRPHPVACALQRVFGEINENAYYTMKSVTLATLAKNDLVRLVG